MDSDVLEIDTSRRRIVDLTEPVRKFCGGHGDGLCNVFVPHATAGVAIACCPVTTATATSTGRQVMAPITYCLLSSHRRSPFRCRAASRCWARGKALCWSI
jgi:hypothetical protein